MKRIPRLPQTRYLLCSDGISRYLESEVIATALCESDDQDLKTARLIEEQREK